MIKFGFLIEEGKIFDTKVQSFSLKKVVDEGNVIYVMTPSSYKRLYIFEALLYSFSTDVVFRILNYNKHLRKQREDFSMSSKEHYMANASVVFNYPPTYLNKRKFQLYKVCQALRKRLD